MRSTSRREASGFSLIEIMVGLGIGLVGILVMFRMVGLWDGHTRTTISGSDAQVSGTLALFNLERDIKQAGMGFGRAKSPFMGCNVSANDAGPPARLFNFPMFPVTIVPGGGGTPDRIDVLYGDSSFYSEEQTFKFSTATTKTTSRRGGFRRGDLAIIAGNETGLPASATCALVEITDDTNADNVTLLHGTGSYFSFYNTAASRVARFNSPGGTGGVFSAGRLYSLGPAPQLNVWQISGAGALTRSDLIHNIGPFDVAERVVNLKAEYGIDTDNDHVVDRWTNAAPADWTTVLAVRAAILVRGKQFERTTDPSFGTPLGVTLANPIWADGSPAHTFVMTNVGGGADSFGPTQDDPNNWRYYRYRVYERVIPLRNMLWGTAP